ncbi:MAG: amidohydrolase [Cytophagales bacterium]|jgi:predicted amidohydrolase YtcJ|nr:amidohydrolase [Flammeovirgaceae bacterium]|tara:strand:- start:5551 stop:7209 length:1659 start_codon:yes stop_codon:yes gene_type:complete
MMKNFNRRTFLASLSPLVMLPFYQQSIDLILYNANIITVNPNQPSAQAIAISSDKIIVVGTNESILKLATGFTKKIDISGKTILPGFIDSHSHPASSGRAHLRNVDCDLRSISAIKKAIYERTKNTPEGEWVEGFKYDDTKTSEKRFINNKDLDEVSPHHPVIIRHRGGHTAYVNSMALTLGGIDRNTADPLGGHIERDAISGELTGRLLESATSAIENLIPNIFSRSEYQAGAKLISQMMSKSGITSVTDAGTDARSYQSYQDAHDAKELKTRIYCMMRGRGVDEMMRAGKKTGDGDEWVRVGAMKLACDGSISERTARLSESYIGRPNDYGIIVNDEEMLYEQAVKAHKKDWQIGIHANGDVGIDIVLNVYERLQKVYYRKDPRFRLEHCTVINDDLIRRIKALKAIPTPFSTYVYWHGEKMKEYGKERLERMFAVKSFLDAGINVTQTSDYPPGPFEPMMAIQSSVTRRDYNGNLWGPSQRITVEEAIKVGTIHGAYASFEEQIKGSLEAGKLADLVVLDQNPLKVDPMSIIDIPIQRTMVGGKWSYES